jgi:hypothetical protein
LRLENCELLDGTLEKALKKEGGSIRSFAVNYYRRWNYDG